MLPYVDYNVDNNEINNTNIFSNYSAVKYNW